MMGLLGWSLPTLAVSATATAPEPTISEKSPVPDPELEPVPPTPTTPPAPPTPTSLYLPSSHHHLSQPETDPIITCIKGFITALNTKSTSDFGKYCVRAGGMSLCPPSPTTPRFCTIGSFVEHIARLDDEIDERIWDPEVMVYNYESHASSREGLNGCGGGEGGGNMAAVWAPFRAKVNGVVNHVGVELFILHKVQGRWKVTGLADSCRRPTEDEKVLLL
ncbi:hypothetical protein BDV19DRAFT_83400 [Aspergillus venezuelensis]